MYGRGGMRGVNPRAMKNIMKQMGMKNEELKIKEITMKAEDGTLYTFKNPSVNQIILQGQKTFQVVGNPEISKEGNNITKGVDIPEEDIELVAKQTGADKDHVIEILKTVKGNPAEAIMKIMSEDS